MPTLRERFEAKFVPVPESGCWLWTGAKAPFGYGKIGVDGKTADAHRVSWQLHRGAIPAGMCVCHTCDVPACVNPAHLFLGTMKDNMRDASRKGRVVAPRGEKGSHLTAAQVAAIRAYGMRRLGRGEAKAVAAQFGVSLGGLYKIRHGLRWTA